MGKTYNPSSMLSDLSLKNRQWVQSVHEALNGSIDMGAPTGNQPLDSSVNAGVYNQFEKSNGSGVLIRVDANGSTGTGASYTWPASGGLAIVHELGRQPIGFHVVDSDKAVQVFRTAAPNNSLIQVSPTDITASVTLYIF